MFYRFHSLCPVEVGEGARQAAVPQLHTQH